MQEFIYPLPSDWESLIKRPTASYNDLEGLVSEVFKKVQVLGDDAIFDYTKQFDQIQLQKLEVSSNELREGIIAVPEELKKAIQNAKSNIKKFHNAKQNNQSKLNL